MAESFQTGNEEVDRQFGGGLPAPSLMLLEGGHGTGKSAVVALLMQGLLESGKKVLCITENTVKDYIENMKAITFNFSTAFLQNRLTIMPLHVYGIRWNREQSAHLLPVIGKYISNSFKETNVVVIDSLSLLTVFSDETKILDFFTQCKYLVASGMTVIITIHPNDIPADIAQRVTGSVDVYLKLGTATVGGNDVKTMKIVKLIGSEIKPESNFAFEVDQSFGIKVVPISTANA
jgi:archaeal flagellar protein FlaH